MPIPRTPVKTDVVVALLNPFRTGTPVRTQYGLTEEGLLILTALDAIILEEKRVRGSGYPLAMFDYWMRQTSGESDVLRGSSVFICVSELAHLGLAVIEMGLMLFVTEHFVKTRVILTLEIQ